MKTQFLIILLTSVFGLGCASGIRAWRDPYGGTRSIGYSRGQLSLGPGDHVGDPSRVIRTSAEAEAIRRDADSRARMTDARAHRIESGSMLLYRPSDGTPGAAAQSRVLDAAERCMERYLPERCAHLLGTVLESSGQGPSPAAAYGGWGIGGFGSGMQYGPGLYGGDFPQARWQSPPFSTTGGERPATRREVAELADHVDENLDMTTRLAEAGTEEGGE